MQLRGKQKRFLRATAHSFHPMFSVGKNGLTDSWVEQLDGALDNHELIKINLQQSADVSPKEVQAFIEERTDIQVVQIIGRVLVLFKVSIDEDKRRISDEVADI
ncbi:ribosome assembly RNA-binding protein YhbY [Pediococcus argentinicus]|nr:ribosome assembly RNA-binding protein YhbY [Pediococcus argentinicus]NKZ22280.1 ribosome assembly RNA-binding protein YhbY [Pediococcus argentinicus]GEP19355.1 RNA-binding protein [Pediococcus argentinicus]